MTESELAMKTCLTLSLLFVAAALPYACKTTQEEKSETSQTSRGATIETNPRPTRNASLHIPPDHCRVVATVIRIEPIVEETNDKNPCSRFPCRAIVRIDSLVGYGSAFPYPLAPGQQIPVTFALTLGPTKETFPRIFPPLPGLPISATFIADVRGSFALGETNPSFSIVMYDIHK